MHPARGLPAGKAISGWKDIYAQVVPPSLDSICVSEHSKDSVDRFLRELFSVNIPKFKPDGELFPLLRTCAASLIMHHVQVGIDCGEGNRISKKLLKAATVAKVRMTANTYARPSDVLAKWSNLVKNDFLLKNERYVVLKMLNTDKL